MAYVLPHTVYISTRCHAIIYASAIPNDGAEACLITRRTKGSHVDPGFSNITALPKPWQRVPILYLSSIHNTFHTSDIPVSHTLAPSIVYTIHLSTSLRVLWSLLGLCSTQHTLSRWKVSHLHHPNSCLCQ
jgi:hypothetical protein